MSASEMGAMLLPRTLANTLTPAVLTDLRPAFLLQHFTCANGSGPQ
jgi:hypothetical protein